MWSKSIRIHCSNFIVVGLFLCLVVSLPQARERKKDSDQSPKIDANKIIQPLSSMMPEYPEKAYEANISAEVWIRCKVDSEKKICSVDVISCSVDSLGFEEAAINWIMNAQFGSVSKTKINAEDWWYAKLNFMIEKWDWHLNAGTFLKAPNFPLDSTYGRRHDSGLVIDEVMPEIISKPKIEYPIRALKYRQSAIVYVRVLVSKEGKPIKVRIEKTPDPDWLWGFNEAAIEGAKKCKFKPAIQDGKSVNVWVSFPFVFDLRR